MDPKFLRPMTCAAALLLLNAQVAYPQTAPVPVAAPAAAPTDQQTKIFKQEQLDQITAPIALYPDDLLAQIMMAASYPIEIVQADRWVRNPENAKLKGDELVRALENQTWDPSVKSLVPFPQVLQMMSENLDWTQKLGDAVLAQQADVMASVQRLRKAADTAGTLKTTEQQTVRTEGETIVIQPSNPQTVYVPVYNPQVVYGTWPYPSYPPPYYPPPPAYYPPAYYPYGGAVAFAAGVAVGAAIWGWGHCNWGGNNIYINNNQFHNINRTNINAGRATQLSGGSGNWQHDPGHRGGVAYRDPQSRQNFQRASTLPASSRQNFRGFEGGSRAGAGTGVRPSQGALGGTGATRPGAGASRPAPGVGPSGPRPSGGPAAATRPAATTRPSAPAFSGMSSGHAANFQASRGQASRSSMSASGGGSFRGAAPSGGGLRRGGGRR